MREQRRPLELGRVESLRVPQQWEHALVDLASPGGKEVAAGLVLAAVGVPCHAPEFRALAAALRAVNHAGGIGTPKPVFGPGKEAVRAYPPQSGRRFRRAAP